MKLSVNDSKRSSLTLFYWKLCKRVLSQIQQPVIDMAEHIDPEHLKTRVAGLMKGDKMKEMIDSLWISVGSTFASEMSRKMLLMKLGIHKQERSEIQLKQDLSSIDYWEDYFRRYTRERSQKITEEIMDGQARIVNDLIDKVLEEGKLGGLGIPEIGRQMRTDLMDGLTEINKYQAERIARTEVLGASDKGSFEAARESGVNPKKLWSTSGLPNIRETHIQYEEEDLKTGGRDMDEEYAAGLQYPHDPDGAPEEIINCRCTIIYDVDEGAGRGAYF